MPVIPMFVISALQSATIVQQTEGNENVIEPRKVDAGVHKDKYAFPSRCQYDPAFSYMIPTFIMMTEVAIDTDEAWPQLEE